VVDRILISLLLSSAAGQTPVGSAALRGFVQDEQGGAIRDAVVEIACGAVHQTVTTDERGAFRVGGLPEGPCTVSAEARLFATRRAPAVAGHSMTLEAQYGVPVVAMHTDKFDRVAR